MSSSSERDAVNDSPASPTARARQRLQGAGDQANYMSNHSVLPLLNDLLGSVVENRPDDVLAFLIEYLVQLQSDVTRARQMLERKNKGGGGGDGVRPLNTDETDTSSSLPILRDTNNDVAILQHILEKHNEDHQKKALWGGQTGSSSAGMRSAQDASHSPPRRLIEVHVDGEIRLIPDFEDFEADGKSSVSGYLPTLGADNSSPSAPVSAASAIGSPAANPVGSVNRNETEEKSSAGLVSSGIAQPPPSIIVVQEPIALRYLLKAAERQKTPSLSILVDLGRAKAQAIATGVGVGPGGSVIPPSTSKSKCLAMAAASNLGLELLQRSSSGDMYQSLSILNNHWMVRKQIVFAVDGATNSTGESGYGDTSAPLSSTPAGAALSSSSVDGIQQEARSYSAESRSVSPTQGHSPALSSSLPPSNNMSPQRMILVQDPTPIRYLLKAAERQYTPTLSLLIDFARKRYGGADIAAPSKRVPRGISQSLPTTSAGQTDEQRSLVTNYNLLGIEILQRSHAKASGFASLGLLANHWMVRRQIVVAVKAKESSIASAFSAPPPLPSCSSFLAAIHGGADVLAGADSSSQNCFPSQHRPSAIIHHQDDLVAVATALSSSQSPSRCVSPAPK